MPFFYKKLVFMTIMCYNFDVSNETTFLNKGKDI